MTRMASHRPIIGIPCSIYPDSWYTPANGNAISYLRAIEAAGGIPALIHLTRDAGVIDMHYARCDAFLFVDGTARHELPGPPDHLAARHMAGRAARCG